MTMDKLQLLKNTTLFSSLSPQELSVVSTLFTEEGFEKDQYLFSEGDPPDWFCIVKEGNIKMVKHSPSGREMIMAIMTAGDVIGEVAVFDGGPYPATAQGMGNGFILKMERKDFVSLLKRYPSIALEIIGAPSGTGVMLTMPITRQDVADMVGSTIETTIRVISRFKKEGLVKDIKGRMFIDVKGLANIVKDMG